MKIFLFIINLMIIVFITSVPVYAGIIDEGNLPSSIGFSLDVFRGMGVSINFPIRKYSIELYGNRDLSGVGFYSHEGKLKTGNSWFYYGLTYGTYYRNYFLEEYDNLCGVILGRRWEGVIGHTAIEFGPLLRKGEAVVIARGIIEIDGEKIPSVPMFGILP